MHSALKTVTALFLSAIVAGLLSACGTTADPPSSQGSIASSASSTTSTTLATTTSTTTTSTTTTTTTTTTSAPAPVLKSDGLPALAQPTAAHPMTILEIGDSLGQDLGFGLQNELGSNPIVKIAPDAVGDTGLARPDYYDWPAHLASELQQYHPAVVIVFLGGNDGQSFDVNGAAVQPFTPAWLSAYTARVATMMKEATSAGARVLWVGMPIMENPVLAQTMRQLNVIYQAQSANHKGVTYFSSWGLFSNAAGQFMPEIAGPGGEELLLRDSDGVHLAGAGDDRLALALIPVMNSAWGIHLEPSAAAEG